MREKVFLYLVVTLVCLVIILVFGYLVLLTEVLPTHQSKPYDIELLKYDGDICDRSFRTYQGDASGFRLGEGDSWKFNPVVWGGKVVYPQTVALKIVDWKMIDGGGNPDLNFRIFGYSEWQFNGEKYSIEKYESGQVIILKHTCIRKE